MKSFYLAVCSILVLAACNTSNNTSKTERTSSTIATQQLSGYFLKNTISYPEDIKYLVVKDKKEFDSLFGVAATMGNKITSPDFVNQTVVALALKETDQTILFKKDQTELVNNDIAFYTTINKGDKMSYRITPVYIFSFPKQASAKTITFLVNNQKQKVLSLK